MKMKKLFLKRSPVFFQYFLGKKKRPGGGGLSSVLCNNGNPAAAAAVPKTMAPAAASSPPPHPPSTLLKTLSKPPPFLLPQTLTFRDYLGLRNTKTTTTTSLNLISRRSLCSTSNNAASAIPPPPSKSVWRDWRILKRWDVPWGWKIVSLTTLACGLSFDLAGLVVEAALPYLGIQFEELSLDEKPVILFVEQVIKTAVALGVLYGLINTFKSKPLPDDMFRYDWRKPFNLKKGWLLWAGIGLVADDVTAVAVYLLGKYPEGETDAIHQRLPSIGSSPICFACMVGLVGVLAPVLEETVCRGFLMVSLTKWVPTPVAVLISASVFALVHQNPSLFPPLFMSGIVLGFSYAQTRNLLTPIAMHAFENTRVLWHDLSQA